jgi:hypothetical protein
MMTLSKVYVNTYQRLIDDKIYAEDDPVCQVRKDPNIVCDHDGNELSTSLLSAFSIFSTGASRPSSLLFHSLVHGHAK